MQNDLADSLENTVREAEQMLRRTPEASAAEPMAPGKWSAKQALGHLIDSATNNHQRFVLAQINNGYEGPGYEQDKWVDIQHYAAAPWNDLITIWANYNLHLTRVIRVMEPDKLALPCKIEGVKGGQPVTLSDVIQDYIAHINHHIDRIRNGYEVE